MCYGYARISRPQQSIERQIRNIKAAFQEEINHYYSAGSLHRYKNGSSRMEYTL